MGGVQPDGRSSAVKVRPRLNPGQELRHCSAMSIKHLRLRISSDPHYRYHLSLYISRSPHRRSSRRSRSTRSRAARSGTGRCGKRAISRMSCSVLANLRCVRACVPMWCACRYRRFMPQSRSRSLSERAHTTTRGPGAGRAARRSACATLGGPSMAESAGASSRQTLYLIRHGESTANAARMKGVHAAYLLEDALLTQAGEAQAKALTLAKAFGNQPPPECAPRAPRAYPEWLVCPPMAVAHTTPHRAGCYWCRR